MDTTVVARSQRYFYEQEKKRPVQISAYIQNHSFLAAIGMLFAVAILGIFSSFSLGRKLLEKVRLICTYDIFNVKCLICFPSLKVSENFLVRHF